MVGLVNVVGVRQEAGHYAFVQKAADNERPAYVVDVAAQSRAEEADHEQVDKTVMELGHEIVQEIEIVVVGSFDFGSDAV